MRPLTSSQAASLIERLIGSGAVLKFGNATGDVWTDLSAATTAPPRVSPGAAARYTRAAGEAWIGVAVPVHGTPWLVWVEVAEQAMLAPARTLLHQMLPITLGLMVLGALAVYGITSRIAAPIESLVEAAEAIASGDYTQRLGLGRQDEIGRLAAAFDIMAARVAGARESLEQRVAERTQQLENANRELEAFSYSVSHDLRAPLRHIDGFAQALAEDHAHGLDKDGLHYLSRIRAGAQRLGALIDDLLSLSRVSRAELNRTEFDLSGMVREIAARLEEENPERQVAWTITPGVRVRADAHLVRVALENLLWNAWKFTARRERAEIEFSATRSASGGLTFSVRDNGAGFDMAYAGKLFGAFQRLHGATEFPGTGVGLATVQRIINRHGGQIQGSGEVENGATFTFTLGER
jgi:signal transduction histidine kinase